MSGLKLTPVAVTATGLSTIVLKYCFHYGTLQTSTLKPVAVTATGFSDPVAGISDPARGGLDVYNSFVLSSF